MAEVSSNTNPKCPVIVAFLRELSYLAMNASEAGGDLALIQTSLLFSCKCTLVSVRTKSFAKIKAARSV